MDTLIRLGHSRIAIIGGDRAISDTSRLRYEGCMQSFTAHGIPFDPSGTTGRALFLSGGVSGDKALLDKGCRFTAIFATADVMAIGRHPRLAGQRPAGAGGRVGHGRGRPAAEQLPGAETGHRPSDRFPCWQSAAWKSCWETSSAARPPAMRRYPL